MIRTGSATDHLDMLQKLVAFLTGRGVSAGVVNAAGTGYVVGDVLSVAGGTSTVTAQFEVTAIGGGGTVTAVLLIQSGIYTVDPTTTGNAVTGGTGTGATLNLTMTNVGWTKNRESFYAVSAVPSAGGTGYVVGDVLTVSGGTNVFPAKFKVATLSGSAVATVTLEDKGEYTTSPGNPASTTGGTGSGCTLTVTYDTNRNMILTGNGAGSDAIVVGIRSFVASSANNWELSGFTGYQAAARFTEQPGVSPGKYDGATATDQQGNYVPLNNAAFDFWIFANSRRFICVFKIGTTYTNMYLGWVNPFATTAEYPYPLAVIGCSSLHDRLFSSTSVSLSGLTDLVAHQASTANGPGQIRDPGGSWRKIQNSQLSGGSRVPVNDCVMFPCGTPHTSGVGLPDLGGNGVHVTTDFVPDSGLPGTPNYTLNQSPASPDYFSPLWPALIIEAAPVRQILGELDNVYWVSANGQVTDLLAEDRILVGTTRHTVFQNCNRTDLWAHLAIKWE